MENHARIKNKIHYAWVVCIMGTLLIFVTMGTVSNGFSIFLPYIMKEQGLSHAQTSSLVTLRCLVSFFAMLGIGFYYKRFSLRAGTGIAAICGAVSFAIYAAARSYPAFCAGAAVSGLCYGLGSMIPVSVLMHNWFRKSQALALGICAAGSGIATIALPTISTALVEHYSLRDAFVIECVGIVALSAVIILFLRGSPADKGLRPYGYEEGEDEGQRASPGARAEAPEADADADAEQPAARTRGLSGRVWLMMGLTSLFMGALANPGFSHLSVLFRTEGFRPMTVALMISVCGLMITLGKIVYGRTTDKIGGLRSSLIFGGLLAAGHIICCFSFVGNEALCIINAVILGFGYPIATVGPSVWTNDLADDAAYAGVLRRLQVTYAGGALVFANVPGAMADFFSSYIPAYILFTALVFAAMIMIFLSYRSRSAGSVAARSA